MAMKKKTGVISIHYGVNFGSSLQAIALQRYLREKDPERYVEVINYIPPRFTLKRRIAAVCSGSLSSIAHKAVRFMRFQENNRKYKQYLSQNATVSPALYNMEQLRSRYRDYDCLIAGSDQVWNSDYNQSVDPAYFLRFASKGTKKIAYAASCGKDSFTQAEWEKIREYTSDFSAIGMRESSAVKMMEDAGIPGCQFVLDPTFLYDRNGWSQFERKDPECPSDYLLLYFLDTDGSDIIRLAKNIARKKNLKTVLIVNGRSKKTREGYGVDYVAYNKTPDVYIWLFRNASYIVTNSFHGVSFSINMERQFVAVKRDKYNARLDSILGAVGLLDRYIGTDETTLKEDIDYTEVNRKKAALYEKSTSFLDQAIQ
ncbi:MAG TPA: hypothetical protein DCY72_03910 [Ruminococcaceae bacterium]|nr:hypothetical protein [Oscillospiraceae bacterium]